MEGASLSEAMVTDYLFWMVFVFLDWWASNCLEITLYPSSNWWAAVRSVELLLLFGIYLNSLFKTKMQN